VRNVVDGPMHTRLQVRVCAGVYNDADVALVLGLGWIGVLEVARWGGYRAWVDKGSPAWAAGAFGRCLQAFVASAAPRSGAHAIECGSHRAAERRL